MSVRATLRLLQVCGLVSAVSAAVACGDDDKPRGPVDDMLPEEEDSSVAAPADSGRPNTLMDAGMGSVMDARAVVPTNDGSLTHDGAVASDAAVSTPLDDAGQPVVPVVSLPHDGTRLAACYREADCKGDDLTCVGSLGVRGAGFCNDACSEDGDCSPLSGVPATCSSDGQCVFDCAGSAGTGGGACPPNMVCRDITEGNLLTFALYRCTYALGAGSKSVVQGGKCKLSHGDGDCAGALVCHLSSGGMTSSPDDGRGLCTPACEVSADCQVPSGSTSVAVCDEGACELDCTAIDSTCPVGSSCRDVEDVPGFSELRCRAD